MRAARAMALLVVILIVISQQSIVLPMKASSSSTPDRFIYGLFTNAKGQWQNPEPPSVAIPAVLNSGALYVQAGNSAPPGTENAHYFQQLINAGMILEVRLDPIDEATGLEKPIADIQQEATMLKQSGYYQAIFVDHALLAPDIQKIVDILHYVGWTLIRTNETPFGTKRQAANPPYGVWVHSAHFDVLSAQTFSGSTTQAIDSKDISYINSIHANFPDSYVMLSLEVPSESDVFATLSNSQQVSLLTAWAQEQSVYGYKVIYPLFTPTGGTHPYDSIAAGTYNLQVNLMATYNQAGTSTLSVSTLTSLTTQTNLTMPLTTQTNLTMPLTTVPSAATTGLSSPLTGFPLESLIIGMMIGLALVATVKRRQNREKPDES